MPPQIGGMETFFGDLIHALQARANVIVLDIAKLKLQKGGKYAIKTGYTGAFKRHIRITLHSYLYSLQHFIKYLFLLSFKQIDIVHIHTASYTSFWEKALLIGVAKCFRKALVLHVHGALFKEFYQHSRGSLQRLIRRALETCDAVVVLSESWKHFFSEITRPQHIFVVENGIDLSPFRKKTPHDDGVRLLHIGEVSARKGIFDLLSAIKDVHHQQKQFHVDIVGPGEIERARKKIVEYQLEEVVTLHGPKRGQEKYAFFERSTLFILASYAEGLPIAIIEALAAGLVVISTSVGGIPDLIISGENGYLVQPGDTTALADNIKKLLEETDLRQTMAQNNRTLAFEHYNIDRCAEKLMHIYNTIL